MAKFAVRDSGFVIAWVALMLVLLLAFAGFSVDLGHWYLNASRIQNASDAAALGGVVFLPDEYDEAEDIAVELAEGHGYDAAHVNVERGDRPNQLRVTITEEVDNFFVSLLGIQTTTVRRTSLAEFEGPVPMGSPENFLGNDPERGVLPDHWMNAGSVRNYVGNGDRFNNGRNSGSALGNSVSLPGGITNPDFRPEGTFYAIKVDQASSDPLRIEVFDPAMYEVGDNCTSSQSNVFNISSASRADLQALAASDPDIPDDWYDDHDDRYVGGNDPVWCSGDHSAGGSGGAGVVDTTYIVRAPDGTPWLDTDNPVVNTASCAPKQFEGRDNSWMRGGGGLDGRLKDAVGEGRVEFPSGAWQQTLANSFRRWVTVCEIPNPEIGTYLLQVRTNAAMGSPLVADASVDTRGHNRYAVRAGFGDDPSNPSWSAGVSVFANGRMPIYVNATGADTEFFLARVTPSTTQRVLNVSLWDISDINQNGEFRIVPPPDSGLSTFSGCSFAKSGGSFAWKNEGNCSFGFHSGNLNEQLVQVSIPIPDGYSCNESDSMGCWITVETPLTGTANDTTTWSANILGDPVRLVE